VRQTGVYTRYMANYLMSIGEPILITSSNVPLGDPAPGITPQDDPPPEPEA